MLVTDADGLAESYAAALYDLNSNEIIINEAGTNIGTWGDIVVIAPGRTTSDATIALGDILMKKPKNPTALSAYYMDNSVTGNYYNALITWTRDSVHNEEYFELTITDVTAASAITLADGTTVSANTAYGDETINLMKITYDLNGGALKLSESAGKITGNYIKYEIFKDADITLLTPSATGYPQLINGHHPWQSWKNAAGTAITEVSDFGNITVTANYNLTSVINYTISDTYGTITATVTTESGDDGNSVTFNKVNELANGTYEVQIIATKPDANGVDKLYSFVCAVTKNK